MGADLFGSFAESTCAALVVSGSTLVIDNGNSVNIDYLMFPLIVSACGIIVCIITSALPIFFTKVRT